MLVLNEHNFQWPPDLRSRLCIKDFYIVLLQFFIDLHDFICPVLFFQTDLTGLQYVWLDPTPACGETDLLKRVYAQITYTIWAGGGREEKGKTQRERESLNGWSITKMEAK